MSHWAGILKNQQCVFTQGIQTSQLAQAASRFEELSFSVEGLKCQACCARLKGHILSHPGVVHCEVDFEKAKLIVQGASLDEGKLIGAIQELGYRAYLTGQASKAKVESIHRNDLNEQRQSSDI